MPVPLYLADDKFEGYVPDPTVATLRTLFNKDTVDNVEGCDPSVFNFKTMLTTPASGEEYVSDELTDSTKAADELLRIRLFGAQAVADSNTEYEEEPPVDLTGEEPPVNLSSDEEDNSGETSEENSETTEEQTDSKSQPPLPKSGRGKDKKAAQQASE